MNGTLPGAGPGAGGPGGSGGPGAGAGAPGAPGGWLPVPPPMPPVGGQPGQGGKLHFKPIPPKTFILTYSISPYSSRYSSRCSYPSSCGPYSYRWSSRLHPSCGSCRSSCCP